MRTTAATIVAALLSFATLITGITGITGTTATAQTAAPGKNDARAREIFKELIEINTTDSVGSTTKAADAMAARLKAAGFTDVQVLGPDPRKGNLVLRWRAPSSTAARKPLLLLAHLDVVEAKREDWSFDPFVFLEKDGFFYGRGTSDDKAMAAQFVANLIRLNEEGYTPDRDLILRRHPLEPRADHLVYVFHGLEHALAAEALLVAVAQLDRFVLAGGRPTRHRRAPRRAARQRDVRFDRRVAPAVENLARVYRYDRAHVSPTLAGDGLRVNARAAFGR